MNQSERWLVCPRPNPRADMRLFLFPYAGGGPTAFYKWPVEFPANIETNIVHYPGRGSRFNEAPFQKLTDLVKAIHQAIQPVLDKPFIFFGHSMGGIIAFELIRQFNLQPQILFVSGCGAPQYTTSDPLIHSLPDSEFIKSLQEFNGLPADVVNNSELMQLLLPTLRADFEAFQNYKFFPNENQLTCPIIAFGGSNDTHVDHNHLEGWRHLTNGSFKSQYFSGDHFFINTERQAVAAYMIAEITSAYAKG